MDDKAIKFSLDDGTEVLKFCMNGDIYVKGNLVENDREVVEGIREFLSKAMSSEVKTTEE